MYTVAYRKVPRDEGTVLVEYIQICTTPLSRLHVHVRHRTLRYVLYFT